MSKPPTVALPDPGALIVAVRRPYRAGARNLQANAIRPVVEFFRIDRSDSMRRAGYKVFSCKDSKGDDRSLSDRSKG